MVAEDTEARVERSPLSKRRSLAMQLVAIVVTLVSLAVVLWMLRSAWPELMEHRDEVRAIPLVAGTVLALASSYMTFEVFVALVRETRTSSLRRPQLAHIYYTSQLLRHLPGRIWGIGYQWMAGTRGGTLGAWIAINLGHMTLAVFFALWSAMLVLGFVAGARWGLFAALAGVCGYAGIWVILASDRMMRLLSLLPASFASAFQRFTAMLSVTEISMQGRIFILLGAGWTLLYGAWAMFGASYPPLGAMGGVQLCAFYLVAWFVGYVSLLTPSGIGIRELVFVWLAKDFPADATALMAIIGRASLLVVDLLMGLLFAYFVPDTVSEFASKE